MSFGLFFALVAVLALSPGRLNLRALYLLVFPWLLALMLIVNAPFLGGAFRQFRLSEEVKRNHALEHGTIYFLRRRCGRKYRIGGRSEDGGFRIHGLGAPDLIVPAFNELKEHLARGDWRPVVSRYCGSNLVTAQGLSIVLLTIAAVLFLIVDLAWPIRLGVLVAIALVYFFVRGVLGLFIQRRRFLSFDFSDASIRSIREVKPHLPNERRTVFFVRTHVRREGPDAG